MCIRDRRKGLPLCLGPIFIGKFLDRYFIIITKALNFFLTSHTIGKNWLLNSIDWTQQGHIIVEEILERMYELIYRVFCLQAIFLSFQTKTSGEKQ